MSPRVLELLGNLDQQTDSVTLDRMMSALQVEMDEQKFQEHMQKRIEASDNMLDQTFPELKPKEPCKAIPVYTSVPHGRPPVGNKSPVIYAGKVNGIHYLAIPVTNYNPDLLDSNPYRTGGRIKLLEDPFEALIATANERIFQRDAEIRGQEQMSWPNPIPDELLGSIGIKPTGHSEQYLVTELLHAVNNRRDTSTKGIISDSLKVGFAMSAEISIARKMALLHSGTSEGNQWEEYIRLRRDQMQGQIAHINDKQQVQTIIYPKNYDPLMGIFSTPGGVHEEYVNAYPQFALGLVIVDRLVSSLGTIEKAWEFMHQVDLREVYDVQRNTTKFQQIMHDPYSSLRSKELIDPAK